MGLFSRVRGAEADPPADALAIDPSGDVSIQKKLTVLDGIDFKQAFGEKLRFWGRYVTLGFQDATLYMRSNTSFAWFAGGVRNDGPMNAGGGTKLMSLNGAGNLDVGGAVTAKTLDLEPMGRVGTHPQGLPLYVTGTGDSDTSGIAEFRHANAEQGIGIGRNTIYAAGSRKDQELTLKADGPVKVTGKGKNSIDFIVNGRLKSDSNEGGLWIGSSRFVGGVEEKIGFFSGGAWRFTVRDNGDVEIPGSVFVKGGFFFTIGDAWRQVGRWGGKTDGWLFSEGGRAPSDRRFKTDLRPISDALEKVLALNGVRYRWGEAGLSHFARRVAEECSAGPDASADDNQKLWDVERRKVRQALSRDNIGLIAQEMEAVVPEVVHEDKEGYKYIEYPQLTALLVEAIKEQNATIESLAARLAALEAR
jgi:hypothetical protein